MTLYLWWARRPLQPACWGCRAISYVERLYFSDLEMLLRTLTPRRMALLKRLHAIGPVSVRALSKELGRDYKNVHTDIRVLERIGLIVREEDGRLLVPWEQIIVEFRLAA